MSYTPTEWESTDVVTATRMNALETAVGEMNMSYTPNTWSDGDILSAEKMNALEQAVASGGGGGGETWNTVFEGNVTTTSAPMGALSPIENLEILDANTIKVTFNGTEYTCEKNQDGSYGAENTNPIDFSEYPFCITYKVGTMTLITQTAGTYSLKIEEPQSGGSSDFSTATMTVNGNFIPSDLFIAPVIEKDPNNEDIAFPQIGSGNSTYTVILYKGRSVLMSMGSQSRTITVSGNIETASTGVYIITGDCTITIS